MVQLSLWHCPRAAEELPSPCSCPSTQLQLWNTWKEMRRRIYLIRIRWHRTILVARFFTHRNRQAVVYAERTSLIILANWWPSSLACCSHSELLQRHKATVTLVSAMPLLEQKVLCVFLKWAKAVKFRHELLSSHSDQESYEVDEWPQKYRSGPNNAIMHIYHLYPKQKSGAGFRMGCFIAFEVSRRYGFESQFPWSEARQYCWNVWVLVWKSCLSFSVLLHEYNSASARRHDHLHTLLQAYSF